MQQTNAPLNLTAAQLRSLKHFSVQTKGNNDIITHDLNMADVSVMLKLAEDGVISIDDAAYTLVQHGACYGVAYDEIVHKGQHAVALTETGSKIMASLFGTSDIKSWRALLDPKLQPTTLTR
jgi:hypothetical protein